MNKGATIPEIKVTIPPILNRVLNSRSQNQGFVGFEQGVGTIWFTGTPSATVIFTKGTTVVSFHFCEFRMLWRTEITPSTFDDTRMDRKDRKQHFAADPRAGVAKT
jgi:hypothetical protein